MMRSVAPQSAAGARREAGCRRPRCKHRTRRPGIGHDRDRGRHSRDDGSAGFFRHVCPGPDERSFTMVKFRTMRAPRPGEVWYQTDEQRVTRMGRFLRSSSIDELPELWNVLRGDMSVVGPRPLVTEYRDQYTPEQRRRHVMRPGITGWAAVNGRHELKFEERLELDVWYVDHWSLALDLRILGMTIVQVLRRSGVATTQDLAAVGFPLPGVEGVQLRSAVPPDEGDDGMGPTAISADGGV